MNISGVIFLEIRKTGCKDQDNCEHEFNILVEGVEKTLEGFYKEKEDYKPGQLFNLYICKKCSRIVAIDYDIYDDSPVLELKIDLYEHAKMKKFIIS